MNENRLTNLNSIKIDDYHAAFLRNERKAILRASPEVKKSFRPALVITFYWLGSAGSAIIL